jgi:competence protein ComEC
VNEEFLLLTECLQSDLLKKIETLNLTEEEKAILATITLGYREGMDWEIRRQFSMAGVAHLLSVSGFHVAIVGRLISSSLFFIPRNEVSKWFRYGLTIFFLWLFVLISGMAAPAIRAALMISLFLTGNVLERMTERYNILFASAFCMLAYNPLYLFDVGFQLSYLAVFSILYFYPRIYRVISVRNPLFRIPWGWIAVSLSAQLGTVGLCLYYFGQFSTVFLLANLPLTLLATILIPITLVWMLFPLESGWIYVGLKILVEWLTYLLFYIVQMFSQVIGATVSFQFDFMSMLTVYGIGVSISLYFHFKQVKYIWCVFGVVLILIFYRMIEKNILYGM